MKPRAGVTLIEVLVASFVMAIGLIALLALFPLGALNMAQAIKDDRVAACVANATAIANAFDLAHDSNVMQAFNSPDLQAPAASAFQVPAPDGPSHPVYADALGFQAYGFAPYQKWVAGLNAGGIPRVSPSFGNTNALALRWFTFLDDVTFAVVPNATGTIVAGGPDAPAGFTERAGLFSWSYLLRRPRNSTPSVVQMWIIVYNQRSLALNGQNLGGDETFYTAGFANGYNPQAPPTVVTLSYAPGSPPHVRAGSWILDCTPGARTAGQYAPGNASFYRVVAATDNGNTIDIEVDTPILANNVATPSKFAVLDGVAEVIYKGTSWLP